MISGMLFFVCRKAETEIVKKIKAKMMSTKQEEFWKQFCQKRNAVEETLKKTLFYGGLNNAEFEVLISCVEGPLSDPRIFYPKLFNQIPHLIDKCNWNMLGCYEWVALLVKYPELADKCDKWNEFAPLNWVNFLRYQPQFADRCDKWNEFGKDEWWFLLVEQPCFSDKCKMMDEFSLSDWRTLLCYQAELVDKCNLNIFKSTDWVKILIKQPQLIEYCNTSIITEKGKAKLLAKYPDLAKYFNDKNNKN